MNEMRKLLNKITHTNNIDVNNSKSIESKIEVFQNDIKKLLQVNTRTARIKIKTLNYCINKLNDLL